MREQDGKNTGLKILAVVLAVLLWLYVVNQDRVNGSQQSIEVPLEYHNIPEGHKVSSAQTVMVRLWGALDVGYAAQDVYAYVDLAGMKAGTHLVPVMVKPMGGALLVSVNPKQVEIVLERIVQNTLPIIYTVIKQPASGYELLDVIITPDTALIQGEDKIIGQVKALNCLLDLSAVTSSADFSVAVVAEDDTGQVISEGIKVIPEIVQVYVATQKRTASKEVKVTAALLGEIGPDYEIVSVLIEPEMVTVIGAPDKVRSMAEVAAEPIDVSGLSQPYSQTVALNVEQGVRFFPEQVEIRLDIRPVGTPEVPGIITDNDNDNDNNNEEIVQPDNAEIDG